MWLKVLFIAGSLASIVALPNLGFVYWQLYKLRKAIGGPRVVSEECLEFLQTQPRMAINLVPLNKLTFIPRPGDSVLLPGDGPQLGAGMYEITGVCHSFTEETEDVCQPSQARLVKVVAYIKRKGY